jgi:hypothetical protein
LMSSPGLGLPEKGVVVVVVDGDDDLLAVL